MNSRLFIVIPCYNEEEVLPITSKMFLEELEDLIHKGKISDNSRILFVNDGSKDKTWEIIENLAAENPHFIGMSQSRNRGHQNAVLIMTAVRSSMVCAASEIRIHFFNVLRQNLFISY